MENIKAALNNETQYLPGEANIPKFLKLGKIHCDPKLTGSLCCAS